MKQWNNSKDNITTIIIPLKDYTPKKILKKIVGTKVTMIARKPHKETK